jgi:hypothetical protein
MSQIFEALVEEALLVRDRHHLAMINPMCDTMPVTRFAVRRPIYLFACFREISA